MTFLKNFVKKILTLHNKKQALAEFDAEKGYHLVTLSFNKTYGTVGTTIQRDITKTDLRMLLNLAENLEGMLLNIGNQIIDKEFIENYKG